MVLFTYFRIEFVSVSACFSVGYGAYRSVLLRLDGAVCSATVCIFKGCLYRDTASSRAQIGAKLEFFRQ